MTSFKSLSPGHGMEESDPPAVLDEDVEFVEDADVDVMVIMMLVLFLGK